LAALCQLCLDPYFRTTKGFMVLIEKEWCSFGHQFARRTGHRDRNYSDDQRSCIFLQWLDCVHQLLHQFPRHFEFNSHMLCTIMHHLYSCRFGTFLFNSDLLRRKNKLREKTVSLWTYFMCSPAAIAGEFTNPLYCKTGKGGLYHLASTPPPSTHAQSQSQAQAQQAQQQSAPKGAATPASPAGTGTGAASSSNGVAATTPASPIGAAAAQPPTPISPPPSAVGSGPVDEWGGRSSVGRGGGDGSVTTMGAVLYPCWTQKSVRVWTDYFLRHTNEQCEQVPVPPSAGAGIAPGGAATPRMYSSESLLQAEIRRVQREAAEALRAAEERAAERQRGLENEVARLKRALAAASATAAAAAAAAAAGDSASPFTMAIGSIDSAGDLLFGALSPTGLLDEPPSPSAAASAAIAPEAATATAVTAETVDSGVAHAADEPTGDELPLEQAAALAALQHRLQRDVDASVREEVEAPEDPRTL
jgi:hypothetical protein